jgi:hypothetical protein
MFGDVDADVYVLVDGDATYAATSAPSMIATLFNDRLDMVVDRRIEQQVSAYRLGHRADNSLLTGFLSVRSELQRCAVRISRLLEALLQILPSAFRWLRDRDRTEHSCAATRAAGRRDRDALFRAAAGLDQQAQHVERRFPYSPHHHEALSLGKATALLRRDRPFFSIVSIDFAILVTITYLETGLVPRFPTAVLSTGMMIAGVLSISSGLVLDTSPAGAARSSSPPIRRSYHCPARGTSRREPARLTSSPALSARCARQPQRPGRSPARTTA